MKKYNIIDENHVKINKFNLIITTILVKDPNGLKIEWWYSTENSCKMRLAYGVPLAQELRYNPLLNQDIAAISEYIDFGELEDEEA